jgi:pimeloyl-ACP methyl ester carboxylesterase
VGAALRHAVQRRYEAGDLAGAAWVFHDYWCGEGAWEALPPAAQAAIAARMPKVAAELHAVMHEPTPLQRYAALEMPVLLMHGERTRPTPRRIVQRLAEVLPRAAVLEVPGADHMGAIAQPGVMCRLIDAFLRSQQHRDQGPSRARAPHGRQEGLVHEAGGLPLPLAGA